MKKSLCMIAILIFFAAGLCFAQNSRPIASNLQAHGIDSQTILVQWSLPSHTKNQSISSLKIFISEKPITSYQELSKKEPAAQLKYNAVNFRHKVNDYHEYYYALVSCTKQGDFSLDFYNQDEAWFDEEFNKPSLTGQEKDYPLILPGVNSTVTGTRVKLDLQKTVPQKQKQKTKKNYENGQMREVPLPFIEIMGARKKKRGTISKTAEDSVKLILKNSSVQKPQIKLLDPFIFEQERLKNVTGDSYFLKEIVDKYFNECNYSKALKELEKFTSINRDKDILRRAFFYTGQCYYFTGDYQKALFNFLEADFDDLNKKWTKSTLTLMEIN